MKTPNPTSKDSKSNHQADGVSPHPSVRRAVEPRLGTVAAGKFTPVLVLLLAMTLPSLARAQFDYTIENGAVTITGYAGPGGELTIPDTIDGLSVTGIGRQAFSANSLLTSVIIPNTVTRIGDFAFSRCTRLSNLNLPRDLMAVGEGAFKDCTRLAALMIPDGVVVIGQSAFRGCTSLTSITMPASVTSLGEGVFARCTGLTAIDVDASNPAYSSLDGVLFNKDQTMLIHCPTAKAGNYSFPGSVTSIAAEAFYGCVNLGSVIIGNRVTSIPGRAFPGCTSLTNLVIPDGVVVIGQSAFPGCTSLISITIPASVTSIEFSAFSDCTSLVSVLLAHGLSELGQGAFARCTSLTDITIPASVTDLGEGVFAACTSLRAIDVDASNPASSSVEGVLLDKARTMVIRCPMAKVGSFTIPNSVINIAAGAFDGCASLAGITIPASVTSIGRSAFFGCAGLTTIMVDSGNMFYSSLDGVLFDKSQTEVIQCPDGKAGNFTIPASVTNINYWAFRNGASLTSITVDAGNALFCSLDGVVFDKGQTSLLRCPAGRTGTVHHPRQRQLHWRCGVRWLHRPHGNLLPWRRPRYQSSVLYGGGSDGLLPPRNHRVARTL